jgi:hypothetical protein
MENQPAEDDTPQFRRSSRKRKVPDDFSAIQAVEEYERAAKLRRVDDAGVGDDLPPLVDDSEEEGALDSPSDGDFEVGEVHDPPSDDEPVVIPAPKKKKKAAVKGPWREVLEHVDMGDFKGASEPEEV